MKIESRAAAKWRLQTLAALYMRSKDQEAQKNARASEQSNSHRRAKRYGSSCPVCKGRHRYVGSSGHMKESSWLADCKTGYATMSIWEKIKVLKKLGGCTECTSWKHKGNCRRKRGRQSKSEGERKVRNRISKAYSRGNEHSHTGRSAHSIEQVTNKVTRQSGRQQHAGCKHKDRLRADKEASQNERSMTIITGDRVTRAEDGSSPEHIISDGQYWTPRHCSPQD